MDNCRQEQSSHLDNGPIVAFGIQSGPAMPNRISELRKERRLSQEGLANLVGTSKPQIWRLENEKRRLTVDWMNRIAEALRCTATDLLEESVKKEVSVVGYVGAGEEIYPFDDHEQGAGLETIEAPPEWCGGVAVRVKGSSMSPRFQDGEHIFYNKNSDIENAIGRDCVVKLSDGRMMVKRLRHGSKRGKYTLLSYNSTVDPIVDVRLEWAAPILWVMVGG